MLLHRSNCCIAFVPWRCVHCLDMTEIKVKQRSPEWFAARKQVVLTASVFGDALGVGRGLAIDFLLSLVSDDPMYKEDPMNPVLQHGTAMEEIICEAYQLITGYRTRESGFWVPGVLDTMMKGVIGVSPDGLVVCKAKTETIHGLVEYKAPVHKMYTENNLTVCGIPRQYIAQIQGQMAVTGTPWCDFFAVCVKTKEIILKRVFFNAKYWFNASTRLKQFAAALKAVQTMKAELGRYSWKMSELDEVKAYDSVSRSDIIGERDIRVKNMLEVDSKGRFRGPAGKWLTFDFLIGSPLQLSPELQSYANRLLAEVDEDIEMASMV